MTNQPTPANIAIGVPEDVTAYDFDTLMSKLQAAQAHNPVTGFYTDVEAVLVLRIELNRRKDIAFKDIRINEVRDALSV